MKRYERTTRKPTMIKAVHHAMQSSSELLALCAKYWNELAYEAIRVRKVDFVED